ncbi:MAG: winged helix-turn-helix transcriptional regulator [candidate division Zixibacteria bacterium]|nr:winged helix-turn-helix transcriptional regulator [candidate division Zixibacteria bacterium]
MDTKRFSKYFKAFGDPSRLRIIRLLSDKEMTVNDVADSVGLSQPTVSRHLAILREAGVVVDRRDKQKVYYSLNKQSVENCCSGFCDCLEIKVKTVRKNKKK